MKIRKYKCSENVPEWILKSNLKDQIIFFCCDVIVLKFYDCAEVYRQTNHGKITGKPFLKVDMRSKLQKLWDAMLFRKDKITGRPTHFMEKDFDYNDKRLKGEK